MKSKPRAAATTLAFCLAIAVMAGCGGGGNGGSSSGSTLTIAQAVAREADGVAVHLDEEVTTEGGVTVSAGVFSNNKLKVFAQDEDDGIMVYHQSAADVDAFQAGDRLRVTGLIRQQDPTSDSNPATGTVLLDITAGSWSVLSSGNALPAPQTVTVAALSSGGNAYTGALVRVEGVRKVTGDWPRAGSRSTQVDISDNTGAPSLVLRFQRNTITQAMGDALEAIGDGAFTVVGVAVQDDASDDGRLSSGYEVWVRGAGDIS